VLSPTAEDLAKEKLPKAALGDFKGKLNELSKSAAELRALHENTPKETGYKPSELVDLENFRRRIGNLVDSYNFTTKQL
jgi:hypothetical protein